MKKEEFDLIGKKISEYESSVDIKTEWNGILKKQQRLKWKKFYFLSTFLLVTLGSIMTYLFLDDFKSQTSQISEQVSEQSTTVLDDRAMNSNKHKEEILQKSVDQKTEPLNSEKKILHETVNQQNENSKAEKKILSNSNDLGRESSMVSSLEKISAPSNTNLLNANEVNQTNNYQPSENFISQKTTDNKASNPGLDQTYRLKNQNVTTRSSDSEIRAKADLPSANFSDLSRLPSLGLQFASASFSLVDRIKLASLSQEALIKPAPKNRRFQLFFHTGLAITNQRFRAKNMEAENYKALRENSERALETYTNDIGVNWFFNEKSYLSIGGNYSISFDKFTHEYEMPKSFTFENVVLQRRFDDITGELIDEIRGDTTLIGSETITTQQFNKYSALNLGVSVGHYLVQKNRFGLAVNGGLFYNLSLKAKGKVLSSEDENSALVSLVGYKKSFGLGFTGGVDFDFKITRAMILSFKYSTSYSLFSATSDDNILSSKFKRHGISLGLKYNL